MLLLQHDNPVIDRVQLTREALALLEDVLEGGLEEAVAHLVTVPVAAQHT